MKLKLASQKDRERYWGIAQSWADQQDWRYTKKADIHGPAEEFVTIKGIAEYLANQNGETVFMSCVEHDYEQIRG